MSSTAADRVLVTAASGFIAGHIVKQLVECGYNVRGTVRSLIDAKTKYKYLYDLIPHDNKNNISLELIECNLNSSEHWESAVKGCQYVIHTANPVPDAMNKKPLKADDYIKPAINGMKYILNACLKYKSTIKRVIYTSSRSAMINCNQLNNDSNKVIIYANDQFTDINNIGNNEYAKSKILSEQYAWKWLKQNNNPFEFVSINPSTVIGPFLNKRIPASVTIIHRILIHDLPLLPHSQSLMSDVRDVAKAHINALTADNVNGNRYLIANNMSLWMKDISMILINKYRDTINITKYEAPDFLVKFFVYLTNDSIMKTFLIPRLSKIQIGYNQPSVIDLDINYRPINQSIIETAESLIKYDYVRYNKNTKKWYNNSYVVFIVALIAFTILVNTCLWFWLFCGIFAIFVFVIFY